jgi:molecular chaperone DnaJ
VTLYDVLGVRRDASLAEIRTAYRRAARRHHPDTGDGSTSAMAAIADAWRVLGDPAARRRYDQSLRAPQPTTAPTDVHPDRDTAPPPVPTPYVTGDPARFPWRFMAVMATAGTLLVLLGAITSGPAEPAKPDNVLEQNSCVVVQPNTDVAEVSCAGPHDGVVRQLIPIGSVCPQGTEAHRDRQGMGTACIVLGAKPAP